MELGRRQEAGAEGVEHRALAVRCGRELQVVEVAGPIANVLACRFVEFPVRGQVVLGERFDVEVVQGVGNAQGGGLAGVQDDPAGAGNEPAAGLFNAAGLDEEVARADVQVSGTGVQGERPRHEQVVAECPLTGTGKVQAAERHAAALQAAPRQAAVKCDHGGPGLKDAAVVQPRLSHVDAGCARRVQSAGVDDQLSRDHERVVEVDAAGGRGRGTAEDERVDLPVFDGTVVDAHLVDDADKHIAAAG